MLLVFFMIVECIHRDIECFQLPNVYCTVANNNFQMMKLVFLSFYKNASV